MEQHFKPGDRVRCIDAGDVATSMLDHGREYVVVKYNPSTSIADPEIYLENVRCSWRQARFTLAGPRDFAVEDEGGVV